MSASGWSARLGTGSLVALLALLPIAIGGFDLDIAAQCLVYALLAMSLDLVFGYTGLVSLGQATYFGVGGYAGGLLAIHLTSDVFAVLAFGLLTGLVLGLATGWLALHVRDVYFLMLTVAYTELASSLATSWSSLTGGSDGLLGIPALSIGSAVSFSGVTDTRSYYYLALVVGVVGYLALRAVVSSPLGRSFVGVRENDRRMEAIGYRVDRLKLTAFVIGSSVAGLAGALWAAYGQIVTPGDVGFSTSALVLVMVMIGGTGTLYGPALGAVVVVVLQTQLSQTFQSWEGILGALFMIVVYVLPGGFAQLTRLVVPRREGRDVPPGGLAIISKLFSRGAGTGRTGTAGQRP